MAHVCMCASTYVCVSYMFVCTCMGIILFNARLALVSFSTAVDHATTISIFKKSFTSIASVLSGFSFFSTVVRPWPIFGNVPSA